MAEPPRLNATADPSGPTVADEASGRSASASSDELAGCPWTVADGVVALVIGILTAAVALVWRTEIVSTDPWHYVQAGLHFPTTSWVPLGYTRYGMVLPVVPVARVFGNAQVTYYFWPVLGSAVLAASTYLVGRRWFGRLAGLLAVAFIFTNWLVFLNMSRFYPDLFSMAIISVALVVAVEVRGRQGRLPGRGHGRTWLGVLLVGLLLGWSFEARETALFSWPIVLGVLWMRGRAVRNTLVAAVGVLVWAMLDIGISAVAYGDPLLKLHTFTRQDLATTSNPADLAVLSDFVGRPRTFYLTYVPRSLLGADAIPGGRWMLVLGILALLAVLVPRRAVRLSSLSFALSYLLFVGIAGMFLPSHPAGRLDVQRYWIPFVVPASLAVAGLVWFTAQILAKAAPNARPARRAATVVLAAALLVAPVLALARAVDHSPVLAPNGGAPLGQVRSFLGTQDTRSATVWTDWQSARVLPIYRKGPFGRTTPLWTARVRSLTAPQARPEPGDYVLLVTAGGRTSCGFCAAALAPWRKDHPTTPRSWTKVLVTRDSAMTLYRVR